MSYTILQDILLRVCHGSSPPGLLRIFGTHSHMQNSMRSSVTLKLKLTLTLTDTGGVVLTLMLGYRPDGELT